MVPEKNMLEHRVSGGVPVLPNNTNQEYRMIVYPTVSTSSLQC